MKIKELIEEDFINYKKASMFIASCSCDWKCCYESGLSTETCQNSSLAKSQTIYISADEILRRYINNPITEAIVIGGLEPMLQFGEIVDLIDTFRKHNVEDAFVIYTGYYENEITDKIEILQTKFRNIIIKFGRYIPNQKPHYDEVLGVQLASDNQKGVTIC